MKFTYNKTFELNILEKMKDGYDPEVFDLTKREITNVDISDQTAKQQLEFIQAEWDEVSDNFYKQLAKFYEKEIVEPEIECRLTRLFKFPYNYKGDHQWFCAPLFSNTAERNRVVMHELCHYFQPDELPRHIKEAIPVILNDKETFKMYGKERGHQDELEQEWREKIWKIYEKGGKYKDILKLIAQN